MTDLETRAKQFFDHLSKALHNGTVTPDKRITSRKIVEVYNSKQYEWGIADEQVREMASWLNLNKYPLCSNSKGYCVSDNVEDVRETVAQLTSRARHLEERVRKLTELVEDMEKRKEQLFKDEKLNHTVKTLELELRSDPALRA